MCKTLAYVYLLYYSWNDIYDIDKQALRRYLKQTETYEF